MMLRRRSISSLQPGAGRGRRALLALAVWGGVLLFAAVPLSSADATISAAAPADTSVTTPDTAVVPSPSPPSVLPLTHDAQLRIANTLEPRPATTAPLALSGLVVDETVSPHGRIFYTEFYGVWQAPPIDGFYTVRVQEKPTPGRGTQVQVFVNDDITFQGRLQPQTDLAEQALHAARRTYAYVWSGRGILKIY